MSLAPSVLPSPSARTLRSNISIALVVGLFLPLTISCGDDSTGPDEDTVVGVWDATSFNALGTDLIADGMTLTASFNASGSYTFSFTNDQVGLCEPGPNCTQGGTYAVTGNTITLDPTDGDSVSFTHSFQQSGSEMTWSGMIDGNAATITFDES